MTDEDLELLLAWRSHPLVYRHFEEQDAPLEWDNHHSWWLSREARRDWIIAVHDGEESRDVGSVYATGLNEEAPAVGVYVGEVSAWGQGIASQAVEFALGWLRNQGFSAATARIHSENIGSRRLFRNAGFNLTGTDGSVMRYRVTL